MNSLLIGNADKTQQLLDIAPTPFLLIDDGPIADAFEEQFPKAKVFDLERHSFNPLKGMDYKRARDFAAALYTANPEGKETLTVRNGKRALTKLLLGNTTRLDKLPVPHKDDFAGVEAAATVDDLLLSPILRRVLCNPTNFSFKGSVIVRLDRATMADFDTFVLATLFMGQHKGHIILTDTGSYFRDFHMSLIRQERLVLSLTFLEELPKRLQQVVLGIRHKIIYRTTLEDAERLIDYTRYPSARDIMWLGDGEYLVAK